LIEISNFCTSRCAYCGLRVSNTALTRYRLSEDEIMACVRQAVDFGYGTVVLQAGEDPGLTREWVAGLVRRIKTETPLAVTLSLGERPEQELLAWRAAGADRYLLRFETSNRPLYDRIHPSPPGRVSDRLGLLPRLREMGYEIGSGVMIGIPGQSYEDLARDIQWFGELDLDMIGVGPFLPHPATPLGDPGLATTAEDQVPSSEEMTYKVIALARLVCPRANIPSTTALATLNRLRGRELGLARGANVVMPNLTPPEYRALYEIYPDKACVRETGDACHTCLACASPPSAAAWAKAAAIRPTFAIHRQTPTHVGLICSTRSPGTPYFQYRSAQDLLILLRVARRSPAPTKTNSEHRVRKDDYAPADRQPAAQRQGACDFIDELQKPFGPPELLDRLRPMLDGAVRDVIAKSLAKQPLTEAETAVLLNASSPELIEEIFAAARQLKRDVYGNRIVLFAPLYIGNYCVNDCEYCGFPRAEPGRDPPDAGRRRRSRRR
jgi:biotin synthase